MCDTMLNSELHSLSTTNETRVNEQVVQQQTEPSVPKRQFPCSASAYRRYHRPNYDVYNSDGVVIGRDT